MHPVCLTIAGSDPSGGAGIQADLKTFHRHGVYGAAAISLITVQNSTGLKSLEILKPELVAAQAMAVLDDLPVQAVKTGALGNAAVVGAVAKCLAGRGLFLVVDPVMASKNGTALLDEEAIAIATQELFPLATLVTPNLEEAGLLLGHKLESISDMKDAARRLRERFGCAAVLIKGGHLDAQELVDVLCDAKGLFEIAAPRVLTPHTRGTGCTYSAAITACLARGIGLREAISKSRVWLQTSIEAAKANGSGRGGLDHFA